MKFCKKRTTSYLSPSQITTTADYVTLEDVNTFHGQDFFNKWFEFIRNKPTIKVSNQDCYYFYDYEFAARQTDSFLNQT